MTQRTPRRQDNLSEYNNNIVCHDNNIITTFEPIRTPDMILLLLY